MQETTNNDRKPVYEIGYMIASSIPEEKVLGEAEMLRAIVTDAGASIVAEEAPHKEPLAYTIRKKTVSGSYDKFTYAYFGWVKFSLGGDKIEAVKKDFEKQPSVLRMMLITTVAENTYLGKHASDIAAAITTKGDGLDAKVEDKKEVKLEAPIAPTSIEEMDKSIDAMVKEV